MNSYNIFVRLRLCLYGEYCGPLHAYDEKAELVKMPNTKDIYLAISAIPDYFAAMYSEDIQVRQEMVVMFIEGYMRPLGYDFNRYVPDVELTELVKGMVSHGYTEEQISAFATCFVNTMMQYEKTVESSMYIKLFGKHSCGVQIDNPDVVDFEMALSAIPEYIDFLTSDYERNYLAEGPVDLDEILNKLTKAMRAENFGEEKEMRFARAWFEAIELLNKVSFQLMDVYLFGEFDYDDGRNEKVCILMPDKLDFARAVDLIPSYIEFLSGYFNPAWDDGVRISPEIQLDRFIVPKMIEHGYSNEKIENYCSMWPKREKSNVDFCSEDGRDNMVVHSDFADFPF